MNVTQLGQNIEAPAVNAIAEAVRGLARDRSLLVKELKETNRSWTRFVDFANEQAAKIEAIDKRIDALLFMSTANSGVTGSAHPRTVDVGLALCKCGRKPDVIPWQHEVNVTPLYAVRCACGRESRWLNNAEAAMTDWNRSSNAEGESRAASARTLHPLVGHFGFWRRP